MTLTTSFSRKLSVVWSIMLLVPLLLGRTIAESNDHGVVYVMTNQSSGNTILVFQRNEDGKVRRIQEVSTGGVGSGGTGDPLGSQGSLILSSDGRLLFAVNAGSNEVSLLAVTERGLKLIDKVPSGGIQPVSVTVHGDLVYVVNAGGTANITGFLLTSFGKLQRIDHGSRALPSGANAGPGQISFTPDGQSVLVTEKTSGQIDIFRLDTEGGIQSVTTQPSNGATPFGFDFISAHTLVVTEAAGGATGASSVSSYALSDGEAEDSGTALSTITRSLANDQTATCWIAVTRNRRIAFSSNAGGGTISSFVLGKRGQLSLLAPIAANLGPSFGPIDLALSADGRFLYALSTNTGAIAGFEIKNAALRQVELVEGLPLSIQGIAVR